MNFVVIGNRKMAVDCMEKIVGRSSCRISLVIGNNEEDLSQPKIKRYCRSRGITFQNSRSLKRDEVIDRITDIAPDYIFNIDSANIIGDRILSIPKYGTINFHNGPLPRYGGVSSCSWAILNGESEHGVTWHFVTREIDAGDVIAQRTFPLAGDETAASLIMRCITEGIDLFGPIVDAIIDDSVPRTAQDRNQATYYSRKDRPFDGRFPFDESGYILERLRRAICFHPVRNIFFYPAINVFFYPAINVPGRLLFVHGFTIIDRDPSPHEPGTVLEVSDHGMSVATMDAVVRFDRALDENNEPVTFSEFMTTGSDEPLQTI